MGLDVYLYRYADKAAYDAWEKASDEHWEKLYATGDGAAAAKDRSRMRKEWEKEHPAPAHEKIEINSKVHPEHLFKVGYFRSSYNSAGFNSVVAKYTGGRGLSYIFDRIGDDYKFQPNWGESLKRARELKDAWEAHLAKAKGHRVRAFDADELKPIVGDGPRTDEEALGKFLETFNRESIPDPDFSWFSNRDGTFFLGKDHLRVRAAIPGTRESFNRRGPCLYLVIEDEPSGERDWYLSALEVVIEACEWVLGQSDADKLWMHWSG